MNVRLLNKFKLFSDVPDLTEEDLKENKPTPISKDDDRKYSHTDIVFDKRKFVITGKLYCGLTRKEFYKILGESYNASTSNSVNSSVDYLVVGGQGSKNYSGKYGKKYKDAIKHNVNIISEYDLIVAMRNSPKFGDVNRTYALNLKKVKKAT